MNSKVTLRNLDRVEANYAVFECARRHGVTGSLCELYWALLHSLIDVGFPPDGTRSAENAPDAAGPGV